MPTKTRCNSLCSVPVHCDTDEWQSLYSRSPRATRLQRRADSRLSLHPEVWWIPRHVEVVPGLHHTLQSSGQIKFRDASVIPETNMNQTTGSWGFFGIFCFGGTVRMANAPWRTRIFLAGASASATHFFWPGGEHWIRWDQTSLETSIKDKADKIR
jgi:hypothetical protein